MAIPKDRMDLDVAETFEQKAKEGGWKQVLSPEKRLRNYAGDELIRGDPYSADGRIHYELKVFDAVAISPDGRPTTSHATNVLQEIGRYLASAELEVLQRRAKAREKAEAAGEASG